MVGLAAGAGPRPYRPPGLSWFAVEAADATEHDAALRRMKDANIALTVGQEAAEARDPFGTRVRFTRALPI